MRNTSLNESLRQYDLDFGAPVVIPDVTLPTRLLIMACSATKAPGEGLTARQRYIGPLWQTLKAVDPNETMAAVAYLSARFGLSDARSPLPDYNNLLSRQGADLMIERGLAGYYPYSKPTYRTERGRLAHLAGRGPLQTGGNEICRMRRDAGRPFKSVAVCGGKDYVRVADAFLAEMRDEGLIEAYAPVTIINDQIGYMRSQLRAWLESEA